MRTRLRIGLIAAAVAALALPASGRGDFQTLYDDYRADGMIDGCIYSSSDLSAGLSEIPADVREYDPGFSAAINAALEQLATGCSAEEQPAPSAGAAVAADDGSPGPPARPPLRFDGGGGGGGIPGILVAVLVLGGAALAATGLLALANYRGWDLQRGVEPLGEGLRRLGERLADSFWALRDRLGF